jgi:hypothetical protein
LPRRLEHLVWDRIRSRGLTIRGWIRIFSNKAIAAM